MSVSKCIPSPGPSIQGAISTQILTVIGLGLAWSLLISWPVTTSCYAAFPFAAPPQSTSPPTLPLAGATKSVALRDIHGSDILWNDTSKLRVYAFLGCDCPVAKLYARRLEELSQRFASHGIEWVGVISNPQDSIDDIEHFAKEIEVTFPFIKDSDQSLADSWKISRTAEVVLVNPQNEVLYHGRVDDQYAPGITRSKTTREDLALAIDAALEGNTPEIAVTEPVGCKIAYVRKSNPSETPETPKVTYADSVAAIFNKHCTECHRPGEIGPFDITNTDELQGWSEMILETIDTRRMPPWHADPGHGSFKNARSMPREEIETVRQWVRTGAPLGDTSQLQIPKIAQSDSSSGWRLDRQPELIVPMRTKAFNIPADGTVEYQYFIVDPKIEEDKWVSAAQVIPGNAAVVHHAIVFIRPPDDKEFTGIGWLTAYVPGQMATKFPPGYARKIPAGSKLVFQMHYTPNGKETSDQSQIGMTFIDDAAVTHEVFTLVGIDQDFEIPPGAPNHEVVARVPYLPRDGELLAVSPHMHVRGSSFELRATRDTDTSILLKVPKYDFNWQHTYEFSERIPFADLKSLEFTASFDNSENNPTNPDPKEYVMWGDQTWEEMAVAFFEVARPRSGSIGASIADRADRKESNSPSNSQISSGTHPTTNNPSTDSPSTIPASDTSEGKDTAETRAAKFADEYLKKLDTNRDGWVSWDEAPRVVQDYSFGQLDRDGDRRISREELVHAMELRSGK